jgi:two-component system, NtrC family, response regulator AtoC
MAHILVVDDDRAFRLSTAALLRGDGHTADSVPDGQAAVESIRATAYDLVILDLRMPGIDGLGLVESLRVWGHDVPILMISGFGTVDSAVNALHLGADDFLLKPVEPEMLSERVRDLLERRPRQPAPNENPGGLVGRSAAMNELYAKIRRVAPTESTVLVTGETGTGKEIVSRAVHELSPRTSGPFLAVNCGALAEGLLESELFGHVKGAFTGATRDRVGLFEAADGGSIFLDEIGEMSLALQQRMLRVLQEREVTRVGATRPTRVDVRVVAATNRDLRALVNQGRFREDLYYRIAVFPLALPALRDRREDIPLLVDHALARLRQRMPNGSSLACSPFAMRLLRSYDWPGNVRELLTALEGAAINASGGRIEAQHLPVEIRAVTDERAREHRYRAASSSDEERNSIAAALTETGGAIGRAAELLGMGRTTLWRKIRAHGLVVRPTQDIDGPDDDLS